MSASHLDSVPAGDNPVWVAPLWVARLMRRSRCLIRCFILCAAIPVAAAAILAASGAHATEATSIAEATAIAEATGRGLFGTREIRAENLAPFPKWTGVLARYQAETGPAAPCPGDTAARCDRERWRQYLADLADRSPLEQIRAVHTEMNRRRYVLDPVNYGVPDYWATPFQFLRRDGDCEDYAIAKFLSLRALGFPNDSLRVVVLRDLNLKVAHAILAVYHEGRVFILDNQISDIVEAATIRHYRPIYSVNEEAWWLHRP